MEIKSDLFKELIWDNLVPILMKWLISKVPFLSFGPLGALASWILMPILNELYSIVREHIDVARIIIRTSELQKKYAEASINFRKLAADQGEDSDAFKDALIADKKAFFDFVALGRPL